MTNVKAFPTLAVVGAYSGYLLETGGFNRIHEVFDHLYPGIMTLGLAAMQSRASDHLEHVVPALAALGPKPEGESSQEYAKRAVDALGATIDVPGPANVSDDEVSAAYAEMAERIKP